MTTIETEINPILLSGERPEACPLSDIFFDPEVDRLEKAIVLDDYQRPGIKPETTHVTPRLAAEASGLLACKGCVMKNECKEYGESISGEYGLESITPVSIAESTKVSDDTLEIMASLGRIEHGKIIEYQEVVRSILKDTLLTELAAGLLRVNPDVFPEAAGVKVVNVASGKTKGIENIDNQEFIFLSMKDVEVLIKKGEAYDAMAAKDDAGYVEALTKIISTKSKQKGQITEIRQGLQDGKIKSSDYSKMSNASDIYELRPNSGQSDKRAFWKLVCNPNPAEPGFKDIVVIHNAGVAKSGEKGGGQTRRRIKAAVNGLKGVKYKRVIPEKDDKKE